MVKKHDKTKKYILRGERNQTYGLDQSKIEHQKYYDKVLSKNNKKIILIILNEYN